MERMLLLPHSCKGRAYRPLPTCKLPRAKRVRTWILKGPCRSEANRLPPNPAPAAFTGLDKGGLVHFQFYHPSAQSVSVVGTFAGDKLQAIPLEHLGGGAWVAQLALPPGRYEYRFLADGAWRPDPLAVEFSYGPTGDVHSVLVVE